MKLSAIIITKNEEKNIARALHSVAFADEQIVIDAESTDRTAEIAHELGATVIVNPWPGYGAQKNVGREKARGEWLLFIDADEEVTPNLRERIIATLERPEVDFYWLRIVTVFLGTPLKRLYGHNPRLVKKESARWSDERVHEQMEVLTAGMDGYHIIKLDDRHSQILPEPLLHHSHETIGSYLQKMHRYTSLDAEQMKRTGRHRSGRAAAVSWHLPWRLSIRQFVKLYFYRRGFWDGWAGLMWCLLSAYYEWEMAQKYLRLANISERKA